MRGRGQGAAVLIIASLVATALFLPAIPAADNRVHIFDNNNLNLSQNNSLQNCTLPDASMQEKYGSTPAPLTIYFFELDQLSLPGPGYMAYGPGMIALAIDPRPIAVLIAICAIIAGFWYLLPHREEEEKEE
jgi:hypothetical protein